MTRAKIWLTYAWIDNQNQDVDYIAQELQAAELQIRLDRWTLQAGHRLWDQIAHFIQSKDESDAWLLYATTNSLGSEPCKEEFAYALDRALHSRGQTYPVIALFPGPVDNQLIPAALRTRLYVSLTDADWKERIKASVENRPLRVAVPLLDPYFWKVHRLTNGYAIEFRPRAGVWFPFTVGVPIDERERLGQQVVVMPGAPDAPPVSGTGSILWYDGEGESSASDGSVWWMITPNGEATPAKSFYLFTKELPSRVAFGPKGQALRWVPLKT